jgi:hypothetical protein
VLLGVLNQQTDLQVGAGQRISAGVTHHPSGARSDQLQPPAGSSRRSASRRLSRGSGTW